MPAVVAFAGQIILSEPGYGPVGRNEDRGRARRAELCAQGVSDPFVQLAPGNCLVLLAGQHKKRVHVLLPAARRALRRQGTADDHGALWRSIRMRFARPHRRRKEVIEGSTVRVMAWMADERRHGLTPHLDVILVVQRPVAVPRPLELLQRGVDRPGDTPSVRNPERARAAARVA